MKSRICMAIIILGATMVTSEAASIKRDHRNSTANVNSGNMTHVSELSSNECRKLGGGVHKYDVCNSGRVCTIRDQNGKTHAVCIQTVLDNIMSGR